MKNKALTLTELVVALGVLAVLAAIMIPSMTGVITDKEKNKFKAVYNIIENTVSNMINNEILYPAGNLTNTQNSQYFCNSFAASINTVTMLNCVDHTGSLTGSSKVIDFETSNGIQWAGFASSNSTDTWPKTIYVDVDGNDGANALDDDIFRVDIASNGKITPFGKAIEYLKED